jgi:hypothetical protein
MSLYDDTATALAASTSAAGSKLAQAVSSIGTGMAKNAAMGLGIAGDLMGGDFDNAGLRLLDSGLLRDLLPGMDGVASQVKYWGTSTPLFGGITPAEAKRLHEEIMATRFAKKNLFLIEVSSELMGDVSNRFNLFATDISYSPITIAGEKRRIGSASQDTVQGSDPVEMRITTKDDQAGTIRRWFSAHSAKVAGTDGTVGVPAEYAIKIKIVHAYISRESNRGGYEDIGLFRPANIEVDLSRRDDNLEEIQMSFTQLDTFMRP